VDVALADVERLDWSVVVVHDVPVGALDRLDDLLTRCAARGVTFTTDFPDDCTPIRAGAPTGSFELLGVGPSRPG
jgi:hypothetical protein